MKSYNLICRQLQETIQRLSSKEVNPAVQESKEFKYKIKELEKKIRDMTNVIEEYPRDFEHSLLFHGIPVADKENFFTKAKVVSEIIRWGKQSYLILSNIFLQGKISEYGGR